MMKEKEKIDYIYFCSKEGKKNRVIIGCENEAGIRVLRICITDRKKSRFRKRKEGNSKRKCKDIENKREEIEEKQDRRTENRKLCWRKIRREVGRYQTEHCVIGADQKMAGRLQLEEELFRARKQELLQNRHWLLEQWGVKKGTGIRSSFLLVVESTGWNRQELLLLLSEAKNYFMDIYIELRSCNVDIEWIEEQMYTEWGVVLHILSKEDASKESADCAFFLLEQWDDTVKRYHYQYGYAVSECENGLKRQRQNREKEKGNLYSGIVYECGEKELPYQMAVNIFYQNFEIYCDFAITSVAIYCVK